MVLLRYLNRSTSSIHQVYQNMQGENEMKKYYWNVYLNGVRAWSCFTKREAEETVSTMKQCTIHANDEIIIKKETLWR